MEAQGLIYCTNGGEGMGLGLREEQGLSTACPCVKGTEQGPPTACTTHGGDRTGIRLTHILHTVWRGWDRTHPMLAHHMEETGLDSHTACICHAKDGTGLTHCLRAWFLRLKYKISFFRIAWFLRSTDRDVGDASSQQELGLISTDPQSVGSPPPHFPQSLPCPTELPVLSAIPRTPTPASSASP